VVAAVAAEAIDTRTRLIEVAVDLFTRHSFAGTSLQMIADELGFTKAAIYHHFRTREQLLAAVLEPMLDELRIVVEAAESRRTAHARAEHMLTGYAALAVRNRGLVAVLAADPSVATALNERAEWGDLIRRQVALLADVDPGPAGAVKAAMVFAGIAGAAGPAWGNFEDDALRGHLVEAGRRTLGLRAPRRS
jgi:AcrR family transcriptional regulator